MKQIANIWETKTFRRYVAINTVFYCPYNFSQCFTLDIHESFLVSTLLTVLYMTNVSVQMH